MAEWVRKEDENGVWLVSGNVEKLIEPSEKWINENQTDNKPQPPSPLEELTNYVLDVDYRLVLVEMGLI